MSVGRETAATPCPNATYCRPTGTLPRFEVHLTQCHRMGSRVVVTVTIDVLTEMMPKAEKVEHSLATTIDVSDGHLHVRRARDSGGALAIYAPGRWVSAVAERGE